MRKPVVLSIRGLLSLLFGIIFFLTTALSIKILNQAVAQNAEANRIVTLTRVSQSLFKTLIPARNERGAVSGALVGESPANTATLTDILALRSAAEKSYNESLTLLAKLDQPMIKPMVGRLIEQHATMNSLRSRADLAVRHSLPERDAGLVASYSQTSQTFLDAIIATSDQLEASSRMIDPVVDHFLSVKRAAWTARLYLGKMVIRTQVAVAGGNNLPPADALAWSQDQARAKLAWEPVMEAMARPGAPAAMVDAVAVANGLFAGSEADARKSIFDKLVAGETVTTPIEVLRRSDTNNNNKVVIVAEMALRAMVDRAQEQSEKALQTVAASSVMLVVALGLSGSGLLIVQRRISNPIQAMTKAMSQLAARNLSTAIPWVGRKDELGAMADAVQVFKDKMIESVRLSADLELRNSCFDAALNNMSQALCMADASGKLVVHNARFARMFDLDPGELIPGRNVASLVGTAESSDPVHPSLIMAVLDKQTVMNRQSTSASFTAGDGSGRVIAVSHEAMPHGGWVATFEDVTERRRTEEKMEYIAHHDQLTGLPNRVLFHSKLHAALESIQFRKTMVALLCLDLDRFKQVNDVYGHPFGDRLLKIVATRLRRCVRDVDTVVRLGGDEFAILQCDHQQPGAAEAMATRIVKELSKPFDLDGQQIFIGTSIGIALATGEATIAEILLRNADIALYHAKSQGRGVHCLYDAQMAVDLREKRETEDALRKALDGVELEVYYQPLYALDADQVCGFEALLRWNHPEKGLISPATFIPLAEETGLIEQVGAWVLQQACQEASGWPEGIKVAVNLSPIQFCNPSLVEIVDRALRTSGLDPARLELEVTESVLIGSSNATLSMMQDLRKLGVRLALDDFGTGYSSLGYLQCFPFNKIKIDRSFVQQIGIQPPSEAIIKAIVDLARCLDMTTTAEGVETEDQLDTLRRIGCTEVQGFLISRPQPVRKLGPWLSRVGGRCNEMERAMLASS